MLTNSILDQSPDRAADGELALRRMQFVIARLPAIADVYVKVKVRIVSACGQQHDQRVVVLQTDHKKPWL
jgi:hypothetical protein